MDNVQKQDISDSWEYDLYASQKRKTKIAWIFASLAIVVGILSLLSIASLLPLKEFSPYVITLDKDTGHLEVTQGLVPSDLTEDEAIVQSDIVKCLVARETYEVHDIQDNFDYANQCFDLDALRDYRNLFADSNPDNPTVLYGYKGRLSVQIKSIQLGINKTATVRFKTILDEENKQQEEHWISSLQYRYTQKPLTLKERLVNPLGFKIINYRRDQEILTK